MFILNAIIYVFGESVPIEYTDNAVLNISIEPDTLDLSLTAFTKKLKNHIFNFLNLLVCETGTFSSIVNFKITCNQEKTINLKYHLQINENPSSLAHDNVEKKIDDLMLNVKKDILLEIVQNDEFKSMKVRLEFGRLGKSK